MSMIANHKTMSPCGSLACNNCQVMQSTARVLSHLFARFDSRFCDRRFKVSHWTCGYRAQNALWATTFGTE